MEELTFFGPLKSDVELLPGKRVVNYPSFIFGGGGGETYTGSKLC